MFNSNEKSNHQRMIETELERAIIRLRAMEIDSEEYAKALTLVERLNEMLENDKPRPVSKDAMLAVGANLLGIILILKHENLNVITSKALGFVARIR